MAADSIAVKKFKRTLRNVRQAWWVLLIIVLFMVFAWLYTGTSCLLASTTGLPCPGCGLTRSFLSLFRGDIMNSLYYHPLLIPGILFVVVYFISWLKFEKTPRLIEKAMIIFVIIALCVFAVRMFLLFPETPPLKYNSSAILPRLAAFIIEILWESGWGLGLQSVFV